MQPLLEVEVDGAEPAWPTFLVIGAMKCGTTALHDLLTQHPDIGTSSPKELNFFFGDDPSGAWGAGNWHRGDEWYRSHFDASSPVRGESSPGYTSPDHTEVGGRIAGLIPDVRLLYLVREPIGRMVSQYRHHVREGSERRRIEDALLDPASQYVARSRYAERLEPFLERFGRGQIAIVVQEELAADPNAVLRDLHAFLGADPRLAPDIAVRYAPTAPLDIDGPLQSLLADAVRDDVEALVALLGRVPWPELSGSGVHRRSPG